MFCTKTLIVLVCLQSQYCQVYDDNLKPIGHPDDYLDINQYDEYDLGHVETDDIFLKGETMKGYWKVMDNPIVPYEPIIDRPLLF